MASPRASESGASLVEYVLLVALVVIAAVVAVQILGGSVDNNLSRSGSRLFSDSIGVVSSPYV